MGRHTAGTRKVGYIESVEILAPIENWRIYSFWNHGTVMSSLHSEVQNLYLQLRRYVRQHGHLHPVQGDLNVID